MKWLNFSYIFTLVLIFIHTPIVIIGQPIYEHEYHHKFGALYIVELILLVLMILDSLFQICIHRKNYLNAWNFIDLISLLGVICLFIVDACIQDFYASSVFKIRAVFRTFKITLLIQQLFSICTSNANKVQNTKLSPVEQVSDILRNIQRRAARGIPLLIDKKQIDFCLEVIKSGKIYEVDIKQIEK